MLSQWHHQHHLKKGSGTGTKNEEDDKRNRGQQDVSNFTSFEVVAFSHFRVGKHQMTPQPCFVYFYYQTNFPQKIAAFLHITIFALATTFLNIVFCTLSLLCSLLLMQPYLHSSLPQQHYQYQHHEFKILPNETST